MLCCRILLQHHDTPPSLRANLVRATISEQYQTKAVVAPDQGPLALAPVACCQRAEPQQMQNRWRLRGSPAQNLQRGKVAKTFAATTRDRTQPVRPRHSHTFGKPWSAAEALLVLVRWA